jgi:hypothetical protein
MIMKRPLLPALAFVALSLGALIAPAAQAPRRIEMRPYEYLNVPAEATTAAVGGLGVVLTNQVKSTVVVQYTGGGPCGPNYDSGMTGSGRSGSGSESGGTDLWLPIGVGVTAVAGLGVMGFWLLRRSRV